MGKNLCNISHIDLAIATGISRNDHDFCFTAAGAGAVFKLVTGGRDGTDECVTAGGASGSDGAILSAGRGVHDHPITVPGSRDNFLRGQNLVATTAMCTFCQTGIGTGGRYSGINDRIVLNGGEGDIFDEATDTAGVAFLTILLTGGVFDPNTGGKLMSGSGDGIDDHITAECAGSGNADGFSAVSTRIGFIGTVKMSNPSKVSAIILFEIGSPAAVHTGIVCCGSYSVATIGVNGGGGTKEDDFP